jgi:hypothetical protein
MHPSGKDPSYPDGRGREVRRGRARGAAGPGFKVHRRDERLVGDMLRYARRRFGTEWLRGAMEVFFEDLEVEPEDSQLFAPWAVHHWPVEGRPVREWFLEERGARLDAAARGWLEAQRSVVVSVWEVREVREGEGLGVRDLLRGEARFVREVRASRHLRVRHGVMGRVVDHDGGSVFCGLYPVPLPPYWAAEVVLAARRGLKVRGKGPVPHAKLADPEATLNLLHAWQDAELAWEEDLAFAEELPLTLMNTEGEPLLLTVDHFEFAPEDRARVLAGLERMQGAEVEEEGVPAVYSFSKAGSAPLTGWEDTVVGRAEVREATVRVETNSVARAEALRSRVEAACEGLLRFRAREHTDPVALMWKMEAAGRSPVAVDVSPLLEVRDVGAAHGLEWVDTPLPVLRGKTPRQAVRGAAGRREVDTLLKELEYLEAELPDGQRADYAALREALGLED